MNANGLLFINRVLSVLNYIIYQLAGKDISKDQDFADAIFKCKFLYFIYTLPNQEHAVAKNATIYI
jgi:hypothetical protein